MKKIILGALVALTFTAAQAQFFGVDTGKLANLMTGLTKLPYDNAQLLMTQTFKALENDGKGYRKAVEFLDRMGDPADSLHNEVLYVTGLKTVTNSFVLSNSEKERPAALLALAQKNAVGSPATDLALTTAAGKATQLLDGTLTLALFYDADCEACTLTRDALAGSTTLAQAAQNGGLRVVGVYTGKSDKAFKKATLPAWTTSTWDKSQQVEQNEAYVLPTAPLFYLINADGKVLVKNEPSLSRVESAVAKVLAADDRATTTLVKALFN